MIGLDTSILLRRLMDDALPRDDAPHEHPGDFSDHLIGTINEQSGCRTTLTFDKAVARSPQFSELQR